MTLWHAIEHKLVDCILFNDSIISLLNNEKLYIHDTY